MSSSSQVRETKRGMIPRSSTLWQAELREVITDPADLLRMLDLQPDLYPGAVAAAKQFSLRVTRHFISLMERGNPNDPLLRQVLPLAEELQPCAGFTKDPVGDHVANAGAGVLRKYHGRALIIATGACAVHCRYCFRRHFPYGDASLYQNRLQNTLQRIEQANDIEEVILSGGDPLTLSDPRLAEIFKGIDGLKRVSRLRIHTRLPTVIPNRVTPAMVRLISRSRLRCVFVVHVNHAAEIDRRFTMAMQKLRSSGALLLNQSVLLHGVNDDANALAKLSEALFLAGVQPYYLHFLDRVSGAAHFSVTRSAGLALLESLRNRLPGYLVPRFVEEQAGALAKLPIF